MKDQEQPDREATSNLINKIVDESIKKVTVTAAECPSCDALIYSRDRHDFHWCPCGDTAIDGGFDYVKTSYRSSPPKLIKLELNVTKKQLFADYNLNTNKYGTILAVDRECLTEKVIDRNTL
jgi:hypothetical protein